ncbi:MAG TPA: hypothetical protein VNI52_02270 [Sphingobacteriaceae bacterium]|nr:hypothetical protein [Sphingobacteriaceae bacterium]
MKIRVTPLSILLAVLFTATAYYLLFPAKNNGSSSGGIFLFLFCVICFFTDMIFRYFIKDLKRIWIVEVCFIIFACVLTFVIKR